MTAQVQSSDNKNNDYRILKYFCIFQIISLIYLISTFFVNNGNNIQQFITLIITVIMVAFIVIAYRKDPSMNFNLKIIYAMTLYTFFVVISIIENFVVQVPFFGNTLSMNLVTDSKNVLNILLLFSIFNLIIAIIWIFFTYFVTVWFNGQFSTNFNKIKLYFYASLVEFAGFILELIGMIQIYFLFTNILKTGYILSGDNSSYTNAIGITSFGILFLILGNVLELITFYKMYRRFSILEKGADTEVYSNTLQMPGALSYLPPSSSSSSSSSPSGSANAVRSVIYCSYCGTKLDINAEFCGSCGNKVIYR